VQDRTDRATPSPARLPGARVRDRLREDLHGAAEVGLQRLLDRHVQVAERLELTGASEGTGVDRAQARVGHDAGDGPLGFLVVGGDQYVERLPRDDALAESAGERGIEGLTTLAPGASCRRTPTTGVDAPCLGVRSVGQERCVLDVTFAGWAATIALIAVLFALDLFVSRPGHAHTVGFREAAIASVLYVSVAIAFGVVFGSIAGWDFGAEYFAGYIVEKSLSVDNLFVFVVIMSTFAVPAEHQQRVLTFGILAALVMRGIFIALGAVLISTFSFMFLIFGLLLLGTAIQLFRHRDQDPDIKENAIVRLTRRVMPVTETYHGGRMIIRTDGRRVATPLFVVLIAIGSSDLLFALDSIPAVFGVTEEPFIVFAANAFALLGLRALYFLVTGLLDRLVYLSTGLSLILAFIGVKLLLHYGHLQDDAIPEVPTSTSLLVIVVVLAITVVASVLKSRSDPHARAHAGSLRDARDDRARARD
jgi:tellurite resistance protein TerC